MAAAWALGGAAVVEGLELVNDIKRSKGKWPWKNKTMMFLLALAIKLAVGSGLGAAMSDDFAAKWPAFVSGATAPLVITRLSEKTPGDGAKP